MKAITQVIIIGSLAMAVNACKKDEKNVAGPQPDQESITTMELHLVNTADPTDTPSARWVQLDLTGATAPNLTNDTLRLKSGATYTGTVKILDTLEDLTPEIIARANYHLLCFEMATSLQLSREATDKDSNNPQYPLGVTNRFVTGTTSSGKMTGRLKHQPGIKNGTCDVGETDLEADFWVVVR